MPRQPGAKAIVAYKGKMVLILRDDKPTIPFPNTWTPPGGGIEEGETPEEAIRRELEEEICMVPKVLEMTEEVPYEDGSVTHRFLAILSSEEYTSIRLGDEGQRLGWFTLKETFALDISPKFRHYLEQKRKTIEELLKRSE